MSDNKRKIKNNGITSEVSLDKTKNYKYDKSGALVEATTIGDDDIVFSGSKSSLRRLADLERNISILASNLTTTDGAITDAFDSGFGGILTTPQRFKSSVQIDGTTAHNAAVAMNNNKITGLGAPSASTDAGTKGYVDTTVAAETTARSTALALKATLASPTFTGTVAGVTKAMVGLSSVDNTADSAKPVSTAQATAISTAQTAATTAAASDANTKVAAEATTARAAEAALGVRINNVLNNTDATALNSLSELVTAFQAADGDLTTSISALSTSALSGLSTEATTRANAVTALDGRVTAVEGQVNGKIGDLTILTTDTKSSLVAAINETDGIAAAATTAIAAEVTRATAAEALLAPKASPTFTGTVSGITKAMVGLTSVDNTADSAKPVSTAQLTALNLKSNLASPVFTGVPAAATAVAGTNTTQLATTAFVAAVQTVAATDASNKANTAQAAAISTAATDATTKANAAQAAAISTAATDATTKANSAQAAAAADATTKADAAQAAAIAAVTNGAGAAFDTLKEIQDAMATDAELSAAIAAITNVSTATALQTARTIGMSGVTATATSFNGSANITIPVTAVPATLLTGTIADARISGSYTGMVNLTGTGTVDFAKFAGLATDTATTPSFTFTGDLTTGIYRPAASQVAVTIAGVQRTMVSATGLSVTGGVSATSFSGSGAALTGLAGASVTGTVANATAAVTAGTLSTTNVNYKGVTDNAVVGQLMWKNYGNGHTIFDASGSLSPVGTPVNNTNAAVGWTGSYPVLMGWNGTSTYGMRVDSARVSDGFNNQANSATISAASANTANTIVLRDASGNFSAGTISATSSSAQYADLAEKYEADAEYVPGTVVSFGGDAEVTASTDADSRVAGVVSTNPAYTMNNELVAEHVVTVAFTGRVPCKVTGTVRKGDLMVSAGNGLARAEANPAPGTIIGKALANHDGVEGIIEVVVGRF